MEKDDLFKLYRLVIEKEQYFLTEHQKRIAFYAGLLSTLVAATTVGIFYAEKWYHFVLVLIGPVLVIKVSSLAERGATRLYQRFLETITMLAKVEEDLGLTKARNKDAKPNGKGWVTVEPFVTKRHMDSRVEGEIKSSKDWVDAHLVKRENYHGVTMSLFRFAKVLGCLLFGFIVFIVIVKLVVSFARLVSDMSTAA